MEHPVGRVKIQLGAGCRCHHHPAADAVRKFISNGVKSENDNNCALGESAPENNN